jgi:hypothetical protein
MLEACAKSSNILSALPDRLSSGLFARATACHLIRARSADAPVNFESRI